MSFISLFEIIKVVVFEVDPESSVFFEYQNQLLKKPSGFITDFNNGNPVFNKGPRSLPKTPPDFIIFFICALLNFMSVDILLIAFLYLVVCFVVNNNS